MITISSPEPATADELLNQRSLVFLPEITETCAAISDVVESSIGRDELPVVLGGDHALAAGSVAGASRASRHLGLLWFDSHADMNTPATSPSGHIHGMSLAVSMGMGDPELTGLGGRTPKVDPKNVVLIGVRDLDPGERETLRSSGATIYTIREVDERGMRDVVHEAVRIAGTVTAGIHVSFDLDVIDPEEAPGVGTAIAGGITYREAHLAMEILAESGKVVSVDLVEVNPVLEDRNQTAALAVELTQSLLGKRIL